MDSKLKKAAVGVGIMLGVSITLMTGIVGYYNLSWPPSFPDTPRPNLQATTDPETIARGQYVVDALVHCTICHTPEEEFLRQDVRGMVPKGGHVWEMGPLATIRSANLTPAGIGDMSDADLARIIRTGINADGHPAPLMVAVGPMADEDLVAVMSYLRSLPPVENDIPPSEIGIAAKVLFQTAMVGFVRPKNLDAPPFVKEGGISIERGRYIAEGPAFCYGCHSEQALRPELAVKEPYFAGAAWADPDPKDDTMELRAPNLTTHKTGVLSYLDEDAFVTRMRSGRMVDHSPMPWENYQLMTEDDLRSIHRYLSSLKPIDNLTGPGYRKAGWEPGQ